MPVSDFPGRRPILLIGTRLLAVAAGLAVAFVHPPWGVLPGLLGLGVLMRLLDGLGGPSRWRSAAALGWLAGMGYFVPSVVWLSHPFEVDAEAQGWMAPFAVALMAAVLSLFWGLAGAVYRLFAPRAARRVLLFAAVFAATEWLRGHMFTGFPWNLIGEVWRAGSEPSQAAAYIGAYGLTWLTVFLAAAPATALEGRPGKAMAAAGVVALVGLYLFGGWRLTRDSARPAQPGPWVRIVQADVKQETKYDAKVFDSIFDRYIDLTARPAGRRPDIVIWPEGAIPAAIEDYLAEGTWTRQRIRKALTPGQTLILGGYRLGTGPQGEPIAFNSLAAIEVSGEGLEVSGVYDKYRLVPFGEYMPFDSVASRWGIKQFVHVGDGFTPGPRPRPLALRALPTVQPLICYESLFPGLTREGARASGVRAAWIANISNDAWFGRGVGPRQHLNLASYRAIEEGLPMVRATPTGISALIDADGRVVRGQRLGADAYGVIDARLPAALPPTAYDRWRDRPFAALLLLGLLGMRPPSRRRSDA